MRKFIWCLLLFIFPFFFLGVQQVSAAASDWRVNYDITYFNVGKKTNNIVIKGWSFLNHVDNYGGKNLHTWIVAYTGTWQKKWMEKPADPNGACIKSGKCLGKKASQYKLRTGEIIDLFYSRCIGSLIDGGCSRKSERENAILQNGRNAVKTNCNESVYNSYCVYHDVGFQIEISLETLAKKFDGKEVKFRIVTKVDTPGTGSKIDSVDLGIIPSSCDRIFGKPCESNKEYTKKTKKTTETKDGQTQNIKTVTRTKITFTLGTLSNEVIMTAQSAIRYANSSNNDKAGGTFDYDANEPKSYIVLNATDIETYSKGSDDQKTFKSRRLLLKEKNNENDSGAWGYSAWVQFTGTLKFKVKEIITEKRTIPKCTNEIHCVGGNCDGKNTPTNISSISGKTCSSASNEYNTCNDTNFQNNCEQTLWATYYYRVPADVFEKWCGNELIEVNSSISGLQLEEIDGKDYYYVPVNFAVNISLAQDVNITIGNGFVNGKKVNSGRNFGYSLNYNINSSWNYLGDYTAATTENNSYTVLTSLEGTNDEGETQSIPYYVWLKEGDILYSDDLEKQYVYGADFYKQIAKNGVKTYLQGFNTADNYVTFPDSNDADSTTTIKNAGINQCTQLDVSNWEAGVENSKSVSCTYKINQAYLKNDGSGHIKYEETPEYYADPYWNENSSLYYIPINLKTGSIFNFQPNFTSLSLFNLIRNTYTPTCNVTAFNEFEKKSGCLTYRPIDTNDPFPKAGSDSSQMPYNWSIYVANNRLIRITEQSFSGISYQTKKVNNSIKNYISTLNKEYIYASYDDIQNNQSVIIHDESPNSIFEKLNSKLNENRCEVGKYDRSNCDIVQGN